MARAFGIVTSSGTHIKVEGLQQYRPIGAFSFLGRYRVIDFPISNMSNSGIDRIQVYVRTKPRSLAEHLGTGRHYNINSKRGKLQLMFAQNSSENDVYNTDIASFYENIEFIERMHEPYVIIAHLTWYMQKITGNFFRHILIPVLISHSCIILWTMQEKNS